MHEMFAKSDVNRIIKLFDLRAPHSCDATLRGRTPRHHKVTRRDDSSTIRTNKLIDVYTLNKELSRTADRSSAYRVNRLMALSIYIIYINRKLCLLTDYQCIDKTTKSRKLKFGT